MSGNRPKIGYINHTFSDTLFDHATNTAHPQSPFIHKVAELYFKYFMFICLCLLLGLLRHISYKQLEEIHMDSLLFLS